jgi:hypothetical protein
VSPTSDEVRLLLDRFRAEAPEAARRLARETVGGLREGLLGGQPAAEWLRSPEGMVVVGSGLGLFAAGVLVGRLLRVDRRVLLQNGVAAAAGFAMGWAVGRRVGAGPNL